MSKGTRLLSLFLAFVGLLTARVAFAYALEDGQLNPAAPAQAASSVPASMAAPARMPAAGSSRPSARASTLAAVSESAFMAKAGMVSQPVPTPMPLPKKITFDGVKEVHILSGDASFALTDGVSAYDEHGGSLRVSIHDSGGFSVDTPGVYMVLLKAEHPDGGLNEFFYRVIYVEPDHNAAPTPTPAPSLRIKGRYNDYVRYRRQVENELKRRMSKLTQALQEKVDKLGTLLSDSGAYHIVLPVDTLQDAGGLTQAEVEALVWEQYGPDSSTRGQEIPLSDLAAANWSDMLAVYVSRNADVTVENPLDLINLKKISYGSIEDVFWDMQDITYYQDAAGEVWIKVRGRGFEEMMARYCMDATRQHVLYELMQPEFQGVFAALTGDAAFVELDSKAQKEIRALLPQGLSIGRENVVLTAHLLVGRVSYFWGGKYPELGWNTEWGLPRTVTSQSSVTYGSVRPYGLDCSGFVTWVFVNAAKDTGVTEAIGNGTANQWAKSQPIGWDDALPGDLAFYYPPGGGHINHVGIVVSREAEGVYQIAHCSSSHDGVVVTSTEASSFRYIRRPYLYGD